ncbi:hypothetical protein MVEN_01193600 [Mycena venus]|uniref:Uncharacterized protein n=1 Tax=Mycena venus TaxID=2733690 RepID=A0A8H7CVR2_9AGAR|nr:hypothetical protein MVEN_01193600 [Mycena venus]
MPSSTNLILCLLFSCLHLWRALQCTLHELEPPARQDRARTLVAVVLINDIVLLGLFQYLYGTAARQLGVTCKVAAIDKIIIPQRARLLLLPPVPSHLSTVAHNSSRLPFSVPQPFWHWRVLHRPSVTLKSFPDRTAANIIPKCAWLLLLPPVPVNTPAIMGNTLRMPPATFSVARPFWRWRVSYRPPFPLIGNTTALALVTGRVSFSLPFVSSITGGRFGIQDSKLSFVRITELPITGLGFSRNEDTISKDGIAIEEVEEDLKDVFVSSSHQEETFEVSSSQDIPVDGRYSRLPLLQHVAAAALLRKLQLKVVEELCYASSEEVVDDKSVQGIEAVEVVDNVSPEGATENVTQEATGVEPVEEIEKLVAPNVAEDTQEENVVDDTTQTLFVKAPSSPPSPEEKKIEVVSTDPAFVVPLFEELELPSYEQFAEDAPPEPLFEKSAFAPLIHVIHRPPPLAILATHTRVKPCEPRASQLSLLARLVSRMPAPVAEPISV